MRRFRRGIPGAILLALALVLGACGSGGDGEEASGGGGGGGGGTKEQLTVGSEGFPEAQIVGEMYAQVLEAAGYEVERQLNIDTREIRLPAMERGDIDVSPEYLASLLSVVDPETTASTDPAKVTEQLQAPLSEMGLKVLEFSDAVDTNAFVVTPEAAEENDLSAVSDLQPVASEMTLGGPAECPKRPFCIPGLKKTYGVEFSDFKALEYGPATVAALESGAVDVALLFSTDPIVADRGLVVLEDDKDLQAADNITPLIREDAESADLVDALDEVSAALATDEITDLNAQVAVEQEDPADVAGAYLEDKGIL